MAQNPPQNSQTGPSRGTPSGSLSLEKRDKKAAQTGATTCSKRKVSTQANEDTGTAPKRARPQVTPRLRTYEPEVHTPSPAQTLKGLFHNPARSIDRDEEPSSVEAKKSDRRSKTNKSAGNKTETTPALNAPDIEDNSISKPEHKNSKQQVPRTHVDYCMNHHAAHIVTKNCQYTLQSFGKTPKKNPWRSTLGEERYGQACRSIKFPPDNFFDAMTCVTIVFESFRGWSEWTVERDSRQCKITEYMQENQMPNSEFAGFYMEICRMANYISAALIVEIEEQTKYFVQSFSNLYKKMASTDDFNPKNYSKDDKLNALIAQKEGRAAHVPAYDSALFEKFANKLQAAIEKRDSDKHMIIHEEILYFVKDRHVIASTDALRMDELLVVDDFIVSYAPSQPQMPMPTIILPDLDKSFGKSVAYQCATGQADEVDADADMEEANTGA
ncbi:hypothetical protein LTR70_006889 [Exophiala xenobiotica]|uniref:Uncharacterized protein n=1 Tax=Lithohypha guttulata TaxID=1690604 RepID=A0ABR0K7W0_9EURO|nr:hypothetical protein LTR24_006377 [Lithohypha guttulata]KAK5315150.1 hypothetical protein LTR70_006889 [Exophiala xenobiotica]